MYDANHYDENNKSVEKSLYPNDSAFCRRLAIVLHDDRTGDDELLARRELLAMLISEIAFGAIPVFLGLYTWQEVI